MAWGFLDAALTVPPTWPGKRTASDRGCLQLAAQRFLGQIQTARLQKVPDEIKHLRGTESVHFDIMPKQ